LIHSKSDATNQIINTKQATWNISRFLLVVCHVFLLVAQSHLVTDHLALGFATTVTHHDSYPTRLEQETISMSVASGAIRVIATLLASVVVYMKLSSSLFLSLAESWPLLFLSLPRSAGEEWPVTPLH